MKRQEKADSYLNAGNYSVAVSAGDAPVFWHPSGGTAQKFEFIAPPAGLRRIAENERVMTLVELETDVLVAGGGMAGVCAAVAAARNGATVVLVQDRSRLGGNSSSEIRMQILGANWLNNRPGWREGGLLEEFRLDDAVNNPERCWELWDLLLYDKVISEANITLLLDSILIAAETEGDRVQQVLVRCDKTEHIYRIKAKVYCDCTGDSRLALESGAEIRCGREARNEFNESLARERPSKETLGSSIMFTSRRCDRAVPFTPPKWARRITREQLRMRTIRSWEYGYWWIEWGGHLDTVRDNERIRFELLSIVMGIWDYIKNSGEFPDSANYALSWVGMFPGKRAARRIVGDHLLTENDLIQGDFEDAVAIGGWPMDDHPPGGFDQPDVPPGAQVVTREVYSIPLRALYSRNIANLMMAGRNISATYVAFTSTRVMGTASVTGQATGTAAALCARYSLTPRQLYQQKERLRELQQTLLRDDQAIKNLRNEDPKDLARLARVTASGECHRAAAGCVVNGSARDIPGGEIQFVPEQDVPARLVGCSAPAEGEINHWAAPMSAGGPWIELAWDQPQTISQIQIAFDSGFQRELTLTASDAINCGIVRGPRPETVRDYTIFYRAPGETRLNPLVEIKGNHQRVNRLCCEPVEAQSIRIHVNATNGDELARVFEIRCYA